MSEGLEVAAGQATVSDAMSGVQAAEDELETAVREHARLVYRIAYSVLRNHHDAEDATQEAFLRVLRYRKDLRDIRDPRTWLARIAWRVSIDRHGCSPVKTEDELNGDLSQLPCFGPTSEHVAITSERKDLLEDLIAALPTKLREPLVLSTLEEMMPRDIAEVLGISEAAVRSRSFRARQILREKLLQMGIGHYETER